MPAPANSSPRKFATPTTGWVVGTIVKTREDKKVGVTPGILSPGDKFYPKNGLTQTKEKIINADGSVSYRERPFGIGHKGGYVSLVYVSTPATGKYPAMRVIEDILDGNGGLIPTAEAVVRGWYGKKTQKDPWESYLADTITRATDSYTQIFKDCGFTFNEETAEWTDPDGKPSQLALKELLGREFGCAQHGSYVKEIEDNNMNAHQPFVDEATGKNIPMYEAGGNGVIKTFINGKTGEKEVVWTTFFANKGYAYGPINLRRDKRADAVIAKKVTGEALTPADEQALKYYRYGLDDLDLASCMISKEKALEYAASGEAVPDRRNRPWIDGSSPRITVTGSVGAGTPGEGGAPGTDDDVPF